ncbi:MAG: hypothetical protein HZA46_17825 [Planctomycetales bacterium]|nr:hypothetical protein [Planctomycetales bacterium]
MAEAVDLAQRACRLQPENGIYLNTLGIAQYRIGDYRRAVDTLTRSTELNTKQLGNPHPVDIGFLAMAHHRVGEEAKARELLALLRERIKDDRWRNYTLANSVLHEAEVLIKENKSVVP